MRRRGRHVAGVAFSASLLFPFALPPPAAEAGEGVVRAVLFVSPTCPHCRKVREETLPPLWKRFEGRFQVGVVSTATPRGRDLYWAAFQRYGVQQRGVPLLVVGDFALVGSDEIPRRLPGLVAAYMGEGGIGWPDVPGLAELVEASAAPPPQSSPGSDTPPQAPPPEPRTAQALPEPAPVPLATLDPQPPPTPTPAPPPRPALPEVTTPRPRTAVATASSLPRAIPAASPIPVPAAAPAEVTIGAGTEPPSFVDRVLTDPRGNGLAILVLAGMVAVVVRSWAAPRRPSRATRANRLDWLTPLLAVAGLGVASYLAHVEVREIEAVCGPVGDCNTVQQSDYARLFGLVPIGVLGVLGFASILVAWGVRRWGAGQRSQWAAVVLVALTGLGTLFSIYLTFLEPFVIGATCLWCLSSAVIMTTLYRLALSPGPNGGPRKRVGPTTPARGVVAT